MEISRYQTHVSLILVGIRQGLYTQSNVTLLRVNPILIPMRVGLVRVCTTNSTGTDARAIQDADLVSSFNLLQNTVTASVCLSVCLCLVHSTLSPASLVLISLTRCLEILSAKLSPRCPSPVQYQRLCRPTLSVSACVFIGTFIIQTQRRVNASATRTHPPPALLYTVYTLSKNFNSVLPVLASFTQRQIMTVFTGVAWNFRDECGDS